MVYLQRKICVILSTYAVRFSQRGAIQCSAFLPVMSHNLLLATTLMTQCLSLHVTDESDTHRDSSQTDRSSTAARCYDNTHVDSTRVSLLHTLISVLNMSLLFNCYSTTAEDELSLQNFATVPSMDVKVLALRPNFVAFAWP